ncbi:tetratricopeptide repeat protein [Acetobacteraceae bacterium ESL0709]|nr:tetratricopeptide repeat protein [Acetobacteraceae bacterium ESL0697]MDF7677791.1 tetratricopeptide repeat protein [Acetobacteraceae bacterium ESL0709]
MAALLDEALQSFQSGNFEEAASLARSVLEQKRDDPYAIHILASIALVRNMPATTIALLGRILPSLPQAEDPFLLGRVYQTFGRALMCENLLDAARSAFFLSIQYFPEEASAHAGLGETLLKMGQPVEAVSSLSQAIRLSPKEAVLWGLLGAAYIQCGQYQQAVPAYDQAQKIVPEESSFYANQGVAFFHLAQWEKAHDALEKAFSLGNRNMETQLTMALVRLSLGNVLSARKIFQQLYNSYPDNPALLLAYGSFCYETGERNEAETLFLAAGKCDPSCDVNDVTVAKAAFNRGAIALEKGQWDEGWSLYEQRKVFSPQLHDASLPEWDGSTGEEAVALKLEGGAGDVMMFLRFLPDAAMRRPLRLDFPPDMLDMLAFMPDVPRSRLVAAGAPVIAWQSLNSLPFLLGKKPDPKPYLHVPGSVEPDLIGLCWAGNADYLYDRRRSVPVSLLEPLRWIKGVRFLGLQREGVPDWMEKAPLAHLSDLALAVQRCALVISVDSLVANMAGAMGKDLWLLHRKGGDWRWSHHFWYRNVRLFAPDQESDIPEETWKPVIRTLGEAVVTWAAQGHRL